MEKYNHKKIESKWQKKWDKDNLHKADDKSGKEKKYILDMFPYPSGDGLHVGHVESYTATDIYSRYLSMNGCNVLHPQGWDAFGLPAENYAIKTGTHPAKTTKKAIATFKRQIDSLGFSYDWSREVNSSDMGYYKWTQWFFLLLYKNGLAYKKKAKVNWCESCKTVLANEQAEGGKCERCESPVMQKDLEQWFFKITDFIEDQVYKGKKIKGLLSGLDDLDWPESTKLGQKNWIGRSEGAMVKFPVILNGTERSEESQENQKDHGFIKENNQERLSVDLQVDQRSFADAQDDNILEVFTTRPDTLFGCTYMVVCPEHELLRNLKLEIARLDSARQGNWDEVEKYIDKSKKKSDLERTDLAKDKTGVELKGIKAINPVNNEEIPIFVADYVLAGYGTGAIMAVPAHDARDHEFAKKYNLPIVEVIKGGEDIQKEAYCDDGENINSEFLNGLPTEKAIKKIIKWLEKKGAGKRAVNYKLRDWLVSRQRYWGAPIPIIYCDKCGEISVSEKNLPVELPTDVDFKPTGEPPLKYSKEFHKVKCPKCGSKARRESDTMDTFVCSSWYYFRYADPKNKKEFANKKMIKKWLPVDVYVGGAEHTVLHLLYSRFFTKALQKYGYIDFNEPFLKLRHQGIILAENGQKMSKSKGNVVNPDDIIEQYGADALRMYEMFMGPLEDMKPWNTKGIVGIERFLEKILNLFNEIINKKTKDPECLRNTNKVIKKVSEDIDNFKFNTAIAAMMEYVNYLQAATKEKNTVNKKVIEALVKLIAPFAPHLSEEIWEKLGHKESIFKQKWPKYDPKLVKDETINLVVQINGKLRDTIETAADISEKEAKKVALESEKIKKWTDGKEIVKVIFVKGRLVNIVVK